MTTITENKAQGPTFRQRQWAMIKHAFSLERAAVHLVTAGLLFAFAVFIKGSHDVSHNGLFAALLMIGAAVQMFRACQHSLTPAAIMLILGFGGQFLLTHHVSAYLSKDDLQMIAGAGVAAMLVACFYKLR